ncbi:MAG: DsrE family protein [Acidobacteria bacterium]|nr:DsrE family protein [Acidobacteriota bacterium]
MKTQIVAALSLVALFLAAPNAAQAQALPIPGIEAASDVPGAKELPDATTEYKVLFDAARAPATPTEVNPILLAAARYLNTLAKVGVPPAHRQIAVVFHQGATPAILKNEEYRKRHNGQDNPNIAIIQALKKAGVDFRVCGQAVLGAKIDRADIQPEIQVDLWALTTIINLELRGYVRIGG